MMASDPARDRYQQSRLAHWDALARRVEARTGWGGAYRQRLAQVYRTLLCGTKVLWKRDYERIPANRASLGDFDPFGDFDLLFGAARLNLKILDLPMRYRQRTYGTTNIQRWRHGRLLLKMVLFAAGRIETGKKVLPTSPAFYQLCDWASTTPRDSLFMIPENGYHFFAFRVYAGRAAVDVQTAQRLNLPVAFQNGMFTVYTVPQGSP